MPYKEIIKNDFEIERCTREAWSIFKGIHTHDCYELYYMEDGDIVYFIDEHSYTAHKGDFIIIPPGAAHKTLPYHSCAHTRILIYFKVEFIQPCIGEDSTVTECLSRSLIGMGSRNTVERILNSLLSEYESETKSTALIRALMTELLVYLSRRPNRLDMNDDKGALEARVNPILEYIDIHYAEDLTLTRLAAEFYITPSYLSRIFVRATEQKFSEYLIACRLKAAVRLLNNTRKKITEIAAETGFHSDNHFCKTFKKYFGTSPRRYRNGTK